MDDFLDLYLQLDVPSPVEEEVWREWFAVWLKTLSVTDPCELSLCLTTDQHIQDLNREFRYVDAATDVLAFAAQETLIPIGIRELSVTKLLGDIVISVPTARVQAKANGHKLSEELAWLASHGLLHLLGWDHPDELSLQRMLNQQRLLMAAVHLPSEVVHGL
ncbi:MAG: rRNA maturation RNase YbeY [Cyanobacteriota bacterium]|nr:rRNA maturation RNase YbeY [Cyanobacteriota bacterium]